MRFHQPLLWIAAVFLISAFARTGSVEASREARQIFPNETWYYGYQPTPGDEPDSIIEDSYDLVAYQLDGEIIPLLEGTIEDIPHLFDLGENHILALVQEEGQPVYYEIEGTDAAKIEPVLDEPDTHFSAYILLDYQAPYAILNNAQTGTPVIIVDLEQDTVQHSDYATFYDFTSCCVLTEARTLQYFARIAEGDDFTLGLVERELESGEERVLFSDPNLQIGTLNASGNRWLLLVNVPDARQREIIIWEGTTEVRRETVVLSERWSWVGDDLYRDDLLCEQDCEIILESPDGELTSITSRDADDEGEIYRNFFPRIRLDDGSLVGQLQYPDQLVKISLDGTIDVFGSLNYSGISTNGSGGISYDGRFAALTFDPQAGGFAVVDTQTGEYVIESDAEAMPNFVSILYFPEGVLANSYSGEETIQYYRTSDQQLFELPAENLSYFDILDDDTLLYVSRSEDTPIQIGLYQLETGELQAAVEGILPLQAQQAIR